jgi:octanoyl-[GcvH]:protein N-octanoyltransferase
VRLLVVRESAPRSPALEVAVAHALLERVSRGELPALVRLYRPAPTLAFGRLDAL